MKEVTEESGDFHDFLRSWHPQAAGGWDVSRSPRLQEAPEAPNHWYLELWWLSLDRKGSLRLIKESCRRDSALLISFSSCGGFVRVETRKGVVLAAV